MQLEAEQDETTKMYTLRQARLQKKKKRFLQAVFYIETFTKVQIKKKCLNLNWTE